MAFSSKQSGGPSSEINVTPLVDVCLVLLILFMILVPKDVPEISVEVPPTNPESRSCGDEPLVLGLDKDGALTLNHRALADRHELGDRLDEALAYREKKVVFVDFDDDANYGEAIDVLDLAKRHGAAVLAVTRRRGWLRPDTLVGI